MKSKIQKTSRQTARAEVTFSESEVNERFQKCLAEFDSKEIETDKASKNTSQFCAYSRLRWIVARQLSDYALAEVIKEAKIACEHHSFAAPDRADENRPFSLEIQLEVSHFGISLQKSRDYNRFNSSGKNEPDEKFIESYLENLDYNLRRSAVDRAESPVSVRSNPELLAAAQKDALDFFHGRKPIPDRVSEILNRPSDKKTLRTKSKKMQR